MEKLFRELKLAAQLIGIRLDMALAGHSCRLGLTHLLIYRLELQVVAEGEIGSAKESPINVEGEDQELHPAEFLQGWDERPVYLGDAYLGHWALEHLIIEPQLLLPLMITIRHGHSLVHSHRYQQDNAD